jgi:DNA-binding IclR family transcriptional regulator
MTMASEKPAPGASASSARTFDRALALLVAITEHSRGARMSDLARETKLSTSTTSRLLTTLENHTLVRRDENGRYRPDTRLMQIAASVLNDLPLYDLAGPHLEALASETSETANLGLPSAGDRVLYLRQETGPHLVQTAAWTGRTVPQEGTAIGAAIMGRLGQDLFAVVRGSIEPDVTGIAAPVYGHSGRIVAALSVIAPTYRTSAEDEQRYGEAVARHASALSQGLGGPSAW